MKLSELPPHHAVILVHSSRNELAKSLFNELKALSPVHRFFDQTVLSMDAARQIVSWSKTPYNSEKIAVISFSTAGIEAQNAMLKMFEEPSNGVRFVLVTSNSKALLPTILSRLHQVTVSETFSTPFEKDAKEFLNTKHTDRMKLPSITKLLKREDEEGRKDRESVRGFILALLNHLPLTAKDSYIVQEVLEAASFASNPSASSKALLEYLALLLPQSKD
jgi:DNA polymerase-3 subunit delta'